MIYKKNKYAAPRTVKEDSSQKSASNTGQTTKYAITYTVKSGDSLYEIAKLYPGVSAKDIMNYNNIDSKIHPGMKLKIPQK